jgi:hypothetical protein
MQTFKETIMKQKTSTMNNQSYKLKNIDVDV